MGLFELRPHVVYHHGCGTAPDIAAHSTAHHQLVKRDADALKQMTVREKRKYRPILRRHIRELTLTADATGGDPTVHRTTAVDQINHWLPPYLRISARHVDRLP